MTGSEFYHSYDPIIFNGVQVPENFPACSFANLNMIQEDPIILCPELPEKSKNTDNKFRVDPITLPRQNRLSDAVVKYVNQVLLGDDMESKVYTIEESNLEATERSFYDVLNDNALDTKHGVSSPHQSMLLGNSICSCKQSNTSGLFDIFSDLQKYKSSVCSCHSGQNQGEFPMQATVKTIPERLARVRSFSSEESDLVQRRRNKYIALCPDERGLHEMFDNILYLYDKKNEAQTSSNNNSNDNPLPGKKGLSKREAVQLRNLLTQCSQSVASNTDSNSASISKLLKKIRSRASIFGDGTQRLAHYFANGLEARLACGRGIPEHVNHAFRTPGADLWKAYKLYLTAFPFMETAYFFSNETILRLVEKAPSVHIIHFGIMHGLQWPPFIEKLSKRPGGPPKLRITGIDLPRHGFRPNAIVDGTKQRLASYCERFNVPFEYHGFVKKWETIADEDFRIREGEVLVVNCLYHYMNLVDDTIVEHSPRDIVLRLIKRISTDIFIHVIVNGTYNSPFFMSRSREALFHFSTLFNMFDANLPRENPTRMVFERDVWGKEITNIIACEGIERVERPETYKQWQLRTVRAGFKQLPLDEEIVKQIQSWVKSYYHKDFFVDVAGHWLLDGWKGRSLFGLSCWKPAD